MDTSVSPNERTYDHLASVYDTLTADYDHATWLRRLHGLAADHGSGGRRLLDVGCGTGSSFLPLLGDGYEVSGCDLSTAMVDAAATRADGRARVFKADMRALPDAGPFDVITCLDDAVNHVLDRSDLVATFASMARVLAPDGVLLFDANTLHMYRTDYASEEHFELAGHRFTWRGRSDADAPANALVPLEIDIARPDGERFSVVQLSRHYPVEVVQDCLRAAGLRTVAVLGQTAGAVLHRDHRELDHRKTVFVARRA